MSGIYKIQNSNTGKIYVGASRNIHKRWIFHRWQLKKGIHPIKSLQKDWDKGHNFDFEIIEECDADLLDEREIFWIKELKANSTGYNSTIGGRGIIGLERTPEHCQHISESLKGRISPMKGRKFSAKHRDRIAKALKGNHNSGFGAQNHASRAVRSITTGKIYECAADAGRDSGCKGNYPSSNILMCCKGHKATAYGQKWEFYNEQKKKKAATN